MTRKNRRRTMWQRLFGWLKPRKAPRQPGLSQRILEALGPLGFSMTRGAMALQLRVPAEKLNSTLSYLQHAGYVERRMAGAYGITAEGIHRRTVATTCGLRRVRKTRLVNDATTTERSS